MVDMRIWNASALFLATLIFLLLLRSDTIYGGGLMEISSAAFKDKGKIPVQHAMPGAGGQNLSVPLTWKNVPPGTKSFALSMVDIHPIAQNWVHWLAINIPLQVTSLEEGASRSRMPAGSKELVNSFGDIGYGGPQPPKGTGEHSYVITVYALTVDKLDLSMDISLREFKKALEGKLVQSATITGMYGR
jgi:Raf kinase inhibitor-like YbhB/YbcL family protein